VWQSAAAADDVDEVSSAHRVYRNLLLYREDGPAGTTDFSAALLFRGKAVPPPATGGKTAVVVADTEAFAKAHGGNSSPLLRARFQR
jgi:hypothetical protein